jgi:hypothetical protein
VKLSVDSDELRIYAGMLLEDRDLAARMGRQAQKTVIERFSMSRFKEGFFTPGISENRCDCISYKHVDGAVSNKHLLQFGKVLIAVIAC